MSRYQDFAAVYDRLNVEVDYPARAAYFHQVISCHGAPGNILLDLGCGTGSLAEELAKLGYSLIGVDNSPEMLMAAYNKRMESGADITYLFQEMTDLDLFGTVDVVVSALDSLNHLTRYEDFCAAIASAAFFLHPDGLMVFDLNTCYKHQVSLANNTFVYDLDDIYCVWQNTTDEEGLTQMELDIFLEGEDGLYERRDASFAERAYTHEQVVEALEKAGMKLAAVYHEDSFDPPRSDSQRLIYVAVHDKSRPDAFLQRPPEDPDRV